MLVRGLTRADRVSSNALVPKSGAQRRYQRIGAEREQDGDFVNSLTLDTTRWAQAHKRIGSIT
jgi:hypothetical protein